MIPEAMECLRRFGERQDKGADMHERIDDAVPAPFVFDRRHFVEQIFRGNGGFYGRLARCGDRHPWLLSHPAFAAERCHRGIRRVSCQCERSIRDTELIRGIRRIHAIRIEPRKRRIRQMADQTHLVQTHRRHACHPDQRKGDDATPAMQIGRVALLKFFSELLWLHHIIFLLCL